MKVLILIGLHFAIPNSHLDISVPTYWNETLTVPDSNHPTVMFFVRTEFLFLRAMELHHSLQITTLSHYGKQC